MKKQFRGSGCAPNTRVNNEGLVNRIAEHEERERKLEKFPLRINNNTVIYVKKEKCTPEYAEEYRQRVKRYTLHD